MTEVIILGVIHEIYKDDVLEFIEEYNPDVIGVEIRPEDINSSKEYLHISYPSEMIEIVYRFSKEIKVYGFDWLGEDMKNKKLSHEYWRNESIKRLYRQFESDKGFEKERELLKIIEEKEEEFIKKSNLKTYNSEIADIFVEIYYKQFFMILDKTPYEEYARFWQERDEHINKNIINIIKENEGKRIIFVMGGAHRYLSIKAIEEKLGNSIDLVKYLG